MMIRLRTVALTVVLLSGCSDENIDSPISQAASDIKEVRWAVGAAQRHPSQADSALAGAPISVPTTVRPRPPGVVPGHHHHGPAAAADNASPRQQALNQHGDHSG
jgi:outer membrane murein-binding lipoprotein Lpp